MASRKKLSKQEVVIEPFTRNDYNEDGTVAISELKRELLPGVQFPISNEANIPIITPNIVTSVSSERSISKLNSNIVLNDDKIAVLNSIDPVQLSNSLSHRGDNRTIKSYNTTILQHYLDLLGVNYEKAKDKMYYVHLLDDVYTKAFNSGRLGKSKKTMGSIDYDDSDDESDEDLFVNLKTSSTSSKSSSSSSVKNAKKKPSGRDIW